MGYKFCCKIKVLIIKNGVSSGKFSITTRIMHIAIYGRAIEYTCKSKISQVFDYFRIHGVRLIYFEPFYLFLKNRLQIDPPGTATFSRHTGLPDDCDLLLSLGGDGTFLESLVFIKDREIPVAGINFGRLGFLAGLGSEPYEDCLDQLLQGTYRIEERTLIEVSSSALPDTFFPYALNDCTLQRKGPEMISVTVSMRQGALPACWADGLIVATPTGSTAYSLSVGGPIVFPDSGVWVVAPIAPHNLNMRPIVIPEQEELRIVMQGRRDRAVLTLDNRSALIPSGSEFCIRKAPFVLRYVSLRNQHFISTLHEKLLWGFDKRNVIK